MSDTAHLVLSLVYRYLDDLPWQIVKSHRRTVKKKIKFGDAQIEVILFNVIKGYTRRAPTTLRSMQTLKCVCQSTTAQ